MKPLKKAIIFVVYSVRCLNLYPKGDGVVKLADHLSLYVNVANPKSLGSGWKRIANFYFVLLNQSDKELYRSPSIEFMYFHVSFLF